MPTEILHCISISVYVHYINTIINDTNIEIIQIIITNILQYHLGVISNRQNQSF